MPRAYAAVQPAFERQIRTRPDSALYSALGGYFARNNQFPCAITAFRKAVELAPRAVEPHYNLALALMQSGDPRNAAGEFKTALTLNPSLPDVRAAYGAVLVDLNDLPGSETQFREALRLSPRHSSALRGMARVLILQREFSAAIPYLQQALSLEPRESDTTSLSVSPTPKAAIPRRPSTS